MRPVVRAAALAVLLTGSAQAVQINTGETTGAYHATFCPKIEAALKLASLPYACTPSQGTAENLRRVAADPRQIGFGQLDVLALEGVLAGAQPAVAVIRRDDVRECLFAVTRNKDVTSWGDLAANAQKLRFVLPPAESGSFATFRFLQSIDGDGLGRARETAHAESADEAIRRALSADDTATLFVQMPDPDNPRFKLVAELGGHFVPVIDRAILRQQVEGEKVYFAEETQVANATWARSGVRVVTACTPLAVFTGSPERVTGSDKARADHRDMIATVRAIKPEALLPEESAIKRLWRRTRELSAAGIEELVELSDKARDKAKPMLERAREATSKAIDVAKEAGREALDKAEKEAKELIERTRPAEKKE